MGGRCAADHAAVQKKPTPLPTCLHVLQATENKDTEAPNKVKAVQGMVKEESKKGKAARQGMVKETATAKAARSRPPSWRRPSMACLAIHSFKTTLTCTLFVCVLVGGCV
jgi:hypothetical protein